MFNIYTGYFAKARKYESKGLVVVSIARYAPKWMSGVMQYLDLAPTSNMFKMSEADYLKAFDNILEKRIPERVVDDLQKLAGDHPVVLCCYEKPGDFCHRHIVAKWLSKFTEYQVEEFDYTPPKKTTSDNSIQTSLF